MSVVVALLKTVRPKQWTKNLILFAPLIFSGRLLQGDAALTVLAAFFVFCGVSGAVYIANDLKDIDADRAHDEKRSRPLASGALPPRVAVAALATLLSGSLIGAFALGGPFGLVTLAYLSLQLAYTFWLKREVILDVMAIAAGFVVRAVAGAVVIGAPGSPWLYACAALLALFLGFAKRRHELIVLEEEAHTHRVTLAEYTPELIDAMLSSVTAATIVTYSLYTFFSPTGQEHELLMLTVPFVAYGMFRYLHLIYKWNLGGSPEEILLTDKPLIIAIALWLISVAIVVYLF